MQTKLRYSTVVRWSDEDDAFVAVVPELPGISGVGSTRAEAESEALVAAGLALDVLREDGKPVPAPLKVQTYSGQLRVRLPKSLHQRLAERAELEDASLNTVIVQALSQYVAGTPTHNYALISAANDPRKVARNDHRLKVVGGNAL